MCKYELQKMEPRISGSMSANLCGTFGVRPQSDRNTQKPRVFCPRPSTTLTQWMKGGKYPSGGRGRNGYAVSRTIRPLDRHKTDLPFVSQEVLYVIPDPLSIPSIAGPGLPPESAFMACAAWRGACSALWRGRRPAPAGHTLQPPRPLTSLSACEAPPLPFSRHH